MAQWVKVFTTKPSNSVSIPSGHTVEGENRLVEVFLCSPRRHSDMPVSTYADTISIDKDI